MADDRDLFDKGFDAIVSRSGRTVALIALAFYPGVGLVLPLALGASTVHLVTANFAGVTMAAAFSLGWLAVQVEAKERRHLLEWTTNLRLLTAEEFEWLVGELFHREGWKVRHTGSQDGPDGNIDLELTMGSDRRIVQCKRWQSWQVGVDDIRSFAGTLLREKLPGSHGTFVTMSDFNVHAREEAKRLGIVLINRHELFKRVEQARRPEPCPICHAPMTLDRSSRGWWLRCVALGCSGKRDLGQEPARALELLTQGPALTSSGPSAT